MRKEFQNLKEISKETEYNALVSAEKKLQIKYSRYVERTAVLVRKTEEFIRFSEKLQDEIKDLEEQKRFLYNEIERIEKLISKRGDLALLTPEEQIKYKNQIRSSNLSLIREKKALEKKEQEYIIKQEELEIAIQDTNLAKTSYYFLSDAEIDLFQKQRPLILEGVEKHGSISLAIKNNAKITMRPSSIMYYAKKHQQFAQDLEIAKQVFKDNLDATLVDRAINGTMNPVFQKGEYIGEYAVKDNKLLVEVAKAKIPETYNPRAYAAANPQGPVGTTINIVSFDGVDETKHGYAKNIGVVQSVDDSGRVERITQAKQLTDFYKNKPGAEIIEAEVIDNEGGNESGTTETDV